jgi:nucleotide-binding universal stress UspA family protein
MLGAFVLGSVSEALVQNSPCPVLIVRGGAWAAPPRVLVAIGPDDTPEHLGDAVLRLPLPQESRVVVASVAEDGGGQAERLAAHLTAGAPGGAAESRSLEGDVADELLRTASEIQADLIVAGARARSGLRANLGLGSVSRALVRRAECSVLVVRPGA